MINIVDSTNIIQTYFDSSYFTDLTKDRVKKADIILLPDLNKFDGVDKAFRPDTKNFYKYAKTSINESYSIQLFENNGEEVILNFHSHEIWLPIIYIEKSNLIDVVFSLIKDFTQERQQRKNDAHLIINFNLYVEDEQNDGCKFITFKGDLEELDRLWLKTEK